MCAADELQRASPIEAFRQARGAETLGVQETLGSELGRFVGYSGRDQSMGCRPAASRAALVLLNGRLPKKPLWALSGEG